MLSIKPSIFTLVFFIIIAPLAKANTDTSDRIDQVIASEHRSKQHKSRDMYRHPKSTLMFFGIKPDMNVLEILPGRGWYTEILAPVLRDTGQLTVANFGKKNTNDYLRKMHNRFVKKLDSQPEQYDKVKTVLFHGKDGYLDSVEDESQDLVLTFRSSHNWIRYGGIDAIYTSFYRVLKPGGILGVVQHRAQKGADAKMSAQQGYVPESYLIQLIQSKGFQLADSAEVNANPKDTKDYAAGVWTLPPSFRLEDVNRDRYAAIGESDRMTLRFIKP